MPDDNLDTKGRLFRHGADKPWEYEITTREAVGLDNCVVMSFAEIRLPRLLEEALRQEEVRNKEDRNKWAMEALKVFAKKLVIEKALPGR